MDPTHAQLICKFPDRLHPVSQTIIDYFIEGKMSTPEFMRFFSLPNSDYIDLAQCFMTMLTG